MLQMVVLPCSLWWWAALAVVVCIALLWSSVRDGATSLCCVHCCAVYKLAPFYPDLEVFNTRTSVRVHGATFRAHPWRYGPL